MKSLVYVVHIIMIHLLKECSLECTHYYIILEESLEAYGTQLMPTFLPLSMNVIENPFYNSTKNMKLLRDNKDCILDFKCDSTCQKDSSTSCLPNAIIPHFMGTDTYISSTIGAKDSKMDSLRATIVANDTETEVPLTTQSTTIVEISTAVNDTEAEIPPTTETKISIGITIVAKDTKTEDPPTTQTTTSVGTATVANDTETEGSPTTESTITVKTFTAANATEVENPPTAQTKISVGITTVGKDAEIESIKSTKPTTTVKTTTTAEDTETKSAFTSESTGTGNSKKKVADTETLAVDFEAKVKTINNTDQSLNNDKIIESSLSANNEDKKEVAKIAAIGVVGASGMSALAYFIGKKVLHLLQYGTYHFPDPNPMNTQV